MLTIRVDGQEVFDESTQKFDVVGGTILQLEHSLVSLSKWESIYEKPFLSQEDRSHEELLGYIKAMTLSSDVPDELYLKLSEANLLEINEYIGRKMTATWFHEAPGAPKSSEVITAEIIYYWMTVFDIDWQAQHWHLNRLFTLIRVCNIKAAKPKKMSRSDAAARQRELNEQRKKQLGTKG